MQNSPYGSRYLNRLLALFCALIALGIPALSQPAPAAPTRKIIAPSEVDFPSSCQIDFSRTLDIPAGKRGFVHTGSDGHFHFTDGTRARFWGVNVSSTRLNLPSDQIERVVEGFARTGLNMVRLEAIDNRDCLLGSKDDPDSLHFDAHYLDCLDHWMDSLRRHGIYYYLDLLDFRTFKAGDNVLNADYFDRGARPYALFDRYLISLQKDYAQRLLTHRNPYSHLRPVDDPALALVEICNEHGFFLYPERLERLVEPYYSDLRGRWNRWLRDRYGSRENLELAWATPAVPAVLRQEEALESLTVELPMLASPPDDAGRASTAPRRTPARLRDGVQFLSGIQRAYFREMRDYLRSIGLQAPVTAVVSSEIVPDVATVAEECDFTAENWYGETDGLDVRWPDLRFISNRNSLRDDTAWGFAPLTAALHWNNKPVVIREWGTSWPNRFRAVSVPEAMAYGALQDYDAMLLFGYQTNTDPRGASPEGLHDLAFQGDPTVWGLFALAGQAYLHGAIRPASHQVTLAYTLDRQNVWPNTISELNRLAWCTRINNVFSASSKSNNMLIPRGGEQDSSALLEMTSRLSGESAAKFGFSGGIWQSDTGEIVRNSRSGLLEVHTPTLCMIAGEFHSGHIYEVGSIRLITPSHFGALIAFSLDGKPLSSSQHLYIKMVSRAENTGELLTKAPRGASVPWALRHTGTIPVLTYGKVSVHPVSVWIMQESGPDSSEQTPGPMLSLNMENGTWEMDVKDGKATLMCDTPEISGAVGVGFTTSRSPMQMTLPPTAEARTASMHKSAPDSRASRPAPHSSAEQERTKKGEGHA